MRSITSMKMQWRCNRKYMAIVSDIVIFGERSLTTVPKESEFNEKKNYVLNT